MTAHDLLKHLGKLDVPYRGGYVTFHEVLLASANCVAGVPVPRIDVTVEAARLASKTVASAAAKLDTPKHNALTALMVAGAKGITVTIPSTNPQSLAISTHEQWVELCEQFCIPVDELAKDMALATFTNVTTNVRKKRGQKKIHVASV